MDCKKNFEVKLTLIRNLEDRLYDFDRKEMFPKIIEECILDTHSLVHADRSPFNFLKFLPSV